MEKQLNVLRDLEDYRCKVYDQLQTSCQEFETENQQLIRRHHLATEQIKRLKILSDEQELQERFTFTYTIVCNYTYHMLHEHI